MNTESGFGRELFWLAVFGVAFGYLEGAVVVYLRTIAYAGGYSFPLEPIPPLILGTEMGREAATLAMLAAAALATGGRALLKLARFLFCFGLWDIFYYVGLKILLGWPPSLFTWDVLFLIPVPWSAPVLAPASVAVCFVAVGAYGIIRRGAVRTRLWQWGAAGAGAALILATFVWNVGPCVSGARLSSYPWPLFGLGLAAFAAAFAAVFIETERLSKP
ncbi:MAG TPA: hypothetical protein VMX79_04290 [bacterium]|nr:hypothetical protein [bacterium]